MKSRKLGDVCDIIMGQAPPGESYNFEFKGWPLVAGAGDFGSKFPSPTKYTTTVSKLSHKGDIILGIRATIGEKVISDKEYCLGRGVAALRDNGGVYQGYLWHWLDSVTPLLRARSKGATFKQVNREDISGLNIPLPPLEEQKRIADILDRAEALREKRRASLALLDSLTQSIFLDMFGDPASNPKQFPMPELAKGINLRGGFAFKSSDYVEQGIPLVRIGEVNRGGVTSENASFLPATYEGTLSRFVVRPGDLLMSLTGTTGKDDYANVVLLDSTFDRYFLNQRVALIEPKADFFDRYYLLQVFRNPKIKASLTSKSRGIRQANISNRDVTELKVPSPPIALQREFAARLSVVQKLRARQVASLVGLDALFASLHHRAFKGEL